MAKFYIITGATINNKPVNFKNTFSSRNSAIDAYFNKYEHEMFNVLDLQVEAEVVKDSKHDIEYVCSPVGNRFRVTRVAY